MSNHDGGPVFPHHFKALNGETMSKAQGVSLRDYFAAMAMQGLLACPKQLQSGADMYARDAYAMADAMIAERDK